MGSVWGIIDAFAAPDVIHWVVTGDGEEAHSWCGQLESHEP